MANKVFMALFVLGAKALMGKEMPSFTFVAMVLGSVFLLETIQRMTAPKEEEAGPIMPEGSGVVVTSAFGKLNPNGGAQEKLDWWLVNKLNLERPLEEIHMQLGMPENITPLMILHQKEQYAIVLPLFAAAAMAMIDFPWFLAVLGVPLGFSLPEMQLRGKVRARQKDIMRNFATVVDLAALTIESGLDYMQAFDKIIKVARKKTELEKEMEKMITEVSLGYSRREALIRFADRTGLQEIRSFVGLVIQSDELGTSLVDLLRNYGGDLRYRRIQNAEKAAAQASTKMLIPMFIFIFPIVFITMLGPMIYNLVAGGMGM